MTYCAFNDLIYSSCVAADRLTEVTPPTSFQLVSPCQDSQLEPEGGQPIITPLRQQQLIVMFLNRMLMMMMMMDCEPSLPQPPHVSVLVGEEAVGVIAAVLQVTEAAAEKCRGVTVRPRTREALHEHVFFAVVTLAVRAHVRRAVSRTWTRQDA